MQKDNIYHTTEKYINLTDEQIISQIKEGNEQALTFLLEKYKDLVNSKVGKYFIIGAEKEDIIQEGMIGLYKAIRNFNSEKQNSFKTFANICVERQLITAIKSSNRQKHIPLNSSVSLNASAYEEDDNSVSIMEILETKSVEDPSDIIANKEYYKYIETKINESLSDFEKQVLEQYKKGQSYVDIATKLNSKVKSVDTAIQRIRKKATKINSELG